jgi:hypothetical protein
MPKQLSASEKGLEVANFAVNLLRKHEISPIFWISTYNTVPE